MGKLYKWVWRGVNVGTVHNKDTYTGFLFQEILFQEIIAKTIEWILRFLNFHLGIIEEKVKKSINQQKIKISWNRNWVYWK